MIEDIENMEGDVDILVIDNFIKDKEMLKELSDTTSEFWEKGFSWWGGWWNSPAETLRHRLIQYIWSTHCPTQFNGISTQGFEHWVGTYGPDEDWDNLNIHKDKDEEIWTKSKETGEGIIVTPKIGTVFYPIDHDIDGGELMIWQDDEYPTMDTPADIILPKFNRLIIFDASKWHHVKKVTRGTRYAVAINLWDEMPETFK